MGAATVLGVGMTPFGKHAGRSLVDLAAEASHRALADAGIAPAQVQCAFFATALAGRFLGDATVGQNALWEVGIHRVPVVNVENACTSGSTAFVLACNAVASGQAEVALAVGGETMSSIGVGLVDSGANELDTQLGMVAPASFALRAVRHMAEFGTTPEQLAGVAVKNRRHAGNNPFAQFRDPLSLAEVLADRMIVDPLTRLQCCPNADGAAAAVVCSPAAARRLGRARAVGVEAAVLCTGDYGNPQDLVRWETDYRGCRLAYEAAGVGPEDLDVVECHDAFSIAEILHYEALGLCATGQGGRLVEEAVTALGGRVPVNVSGGLLSRGHPPGATGLAQVWEIVTQLRNQAGPRQVEGARLGLAHCMGGDKAGDTKSCTVLVFAR